MKKLFTIVSAVLLGTSAFAQFGKWQAAEKKTIKDDQTGVKLTLLTDTLKNDKFIYQTDPMWTYDQKYLMFRSSSRSEKAPEAAEAAPQGPNGRRMNFAPTHTYFIEVATGKIIQATDGNGGQGYLANRSNKLFFSRTERGTEPGQPGKWSMYVMDLDKFFADAAKGKATKQDDYMTCLGTFPTSKEMGNPGSFCISSEDDYAYITVSREGTQEEMDRMNANAFVPRDDQPVKTRQHLSGIRKMNLKTGETSFVVNCEFSVGHIQCSRFRNDEIVFCCETGGDANQRMWYVKADGSDFKPLYKETALDWVTHETFGTEDYVYFNVLGWQPQLRKQANGIFRINLRTDDVDCLGNVEMEKDRSSALTGRGFWHCNSTRDNRLACGDTFGGSIWVIDVATGHKYQISSGNRMAPDHAQPFFSPDGTKLCYQTGKYSNAKRLNLVIVDLNKIPGLAKKK